MHIISPKYESQSGQEYFNWQRKIGELGGKLNLFKFQKYIGPNDVICDLGCGGGYLLYQIKAKEKHGVEVNQSAIEVCQEKGISTFKSAGELPKNHYDVIISNHALEHIPNPFEVLVQLKSRLKDSGKIVFCLPIDDWHVQNKYQKQDMHNHLYTWTPQLIGNLFSEAGFNVIDTKILKHAWSPKIYSWFHHNNSIYNLVCYLNCLIKKRYQVVVVGEKRIDG